MPSEVVLSEVDARGLATVALNRPEVHNAYDADVLERLLAALAVLEADAGVRVVLLRGRGKHFQAGADLRWLQRLAGSPEDNRVAAALTARAVRALQEFPRPTIALVHGACYGGGVGLVAACDMALATADAVFALAEVRVGVLPAPIMPQLIGAMGVRAVSRYALTGERFDAREAHRLGLVHAVCPAGDLDAAVAPMVEGLLLGGPEAVAGTKRLAREVAEGRLGDDPMPELVARATAQRASPEAAEGLASALARRRPAWFPGA